MRRLCKTNRFCASERGCAAPGSGGGGCARLAAARCALSAHGSAQLARLSLQSQRISRTSIYSHRQEFAQVLGLTFVASGVRRNLSCAFYIAKLSFPGQLLPALSFPVETSIDREKPGKPFRPKFIAYPYVEQNLPPPTELFRFYGDRDADSANWQIGTSAREDNQRRSFDIDQAR
jgi:hypothetical protein